MSASVDKSNADLLAARSELAEYRTQLDPQWEEMEEVLVSVDVDGWEIYMKKTRPKGQRLPNEVDPERAQLHHTPQVKDQSDAESTSSWHLLESVDAALPGEPEHIEAHEIKEPEMDGDLINAVLKPFLDKLPMVSDERDIDEPDADEEVVFKTPIVGGSASPFSQRKRRSHLMNKIHAVEFKLDGSGVVNILDTDITRAREYCWVTKARSTITPSGSCGPAKGKVGHSIQSTTFDVESFTEGTTAEVCCIRCFGFFGKMPRKEPPMASAPPVPAGTGGPQPPTEPPLRPSGYPKWYILLLPGNGRAPCIHHQMHRAPRAA